MLLVPSLIGEKERSKMKIQEIMTKDPSCVTPEATVREAAQVMKRDEVGVVPVVNGKAEKRLVGIVTDRDIAIRCVAEGKDGSCRVRDAMSSREIATCSPQHNVDDAMKTMSNEKIRRIPVVDERGSLVGIVSQADLLIRVRVD